MNILSSGCIVRYGSGSTALARLRSPHAGGWHADQCMGGVTFISGSLAPADEEDLATWKRKACFRGEAPWPMDLPRIRRRDGSWTVFIPSRPLRSKAVKYLLAEYDAKAQQLCDRLNNCKV